MFSRLLPSHNLMPAARLAVIAWREYVDGLREVLQVQVN